MAWQAGGCPALPLALEPSLDHVGALISDCGIGVQGRAGELPRRGGTLVPTAGWTHAARAPAFSAADSSAFPGTRRSERETLRSSSASHVPHRSSGCWVPQTGLLPSGARAGERAACGCSFGL